MRSESPSPSIHSRTSSRSGSDSAQRPTGRRPSSPSHGPAFPRRVLTTPFTGIALSHGVGLADRAPASGDSVKRRRTGIARGSVPVRREEQRQVLDP